MLKTLGRLYTDRLEKGGQGSGKRGHTRPGMTQGQRGMVDHLVEKKRKGKLVAKGGPGSGCHGDNCGRPSSGSGETPKMPSYNRVRGENQYIFTHGKKPSGQGTWAFESEGKTHFITGKYSEAKAKAERELKDPKLLT